MNNHFEDPFIKILPKLDLHGETSDTIQALIIEFLKSNIKMRHYKVVIVHGRHGGVLKKRTHEILKTLSYVDRYYIYSFNDGITIVELTDTD